MYLFIPSPSLLYLCFFVLMPLKTCTYLLSLLLFLILIWSAPLNNFSHSSTPPYTLTLFTVSPHFSFSSPLPVHPHSFPFSPSFLPLHSYTLLLTPSPFLPAFSSSLHTPSNSFSYPLPRHPQYLLTHSPSSLPLQLHSSLPSLSLSLTPTNPLLLLPSPRHTLHDTLTRSVRSL